MAHKKGASASRNGRYSGPQYLGVKKFGGESVIAGNIIVRQRGSKFHAGENVGTGKELRISPNKPSSVCSASLFVSSRAKILSIRPRPLPPLGLMPFSGFLCDGTCLTRHQLQQYSNYSGKPRGFLGAEVNKRS